MNEREVTLAGDGALLRLATRSIGPNPDNPRLIFRSEELEELENSIKNQGVLVPLTVFKNDGEESYTILDGERRWRCARRLGLERIPAIVQEKPAPMQNIVMMFAIHNAREDWDPLPSALKLGELQILFEQQRGRPAKERELADLASMTVGEVRRLRQILDLPDEYVQELMTELEQPRHSQKITVDQVLETTRGLMALARRSVLAPDEVEVVRRAVVDKYREGAIDSTVDPRLLARLARSVERDEVSKVDAHRAVMRLLEPSVTIRAVFEDVGRRSDSEHRVETTAIRLTQAIRALRQDSSFDVSLVDTVRAALLEARRAIDELLDADHEL